MSNDLPTAQIITTQAPTNFPQLMEETLSLLQKTFLSVDKDTRDKAAQRLKTLENDLFQHSKLIICTLKENYLAMKDLGIALILHIKRIIKARLSDHSLTNEDANELMKTYIDAIVTPMIPELFMHNLSSALQDILDYSIVARYPQNIFYLLNYIQEIVANISSNVMSYYGIVMVYENILESSLLTGDNSLEVMCNILSNCDLMLSRILYGLELESGNIVSSESLEAFLMYISSCKSIFSFLFITVNKSRKELNIIDQLLDIYFTSFIPRGTKLVCLSLKDILTVPPIAWQGNSAFDNGINSMKSKVLRFINSLLVNLPSKVQNQDIVNLHTGLIQVNMTCLEYTVNNKFEYIKHMNRESSKYPDYNYENLLYQMMVYLSKIFCREPFLEMFSPYLLNFAKNLLLPLLATKEREMIQFQEEGEEYSIYINDIVRDQKQKTIKTAAAQLLAYLCEKDKRLAVCYVEYCLQLIDFCIKVKCCQHVNLSTFPKLSHEDSILKKVDIDIALETAILSLCALATSIVRQYPLLIQTKFLFEENLKEFLSIDLMPGIVRHRICLFIGMYIDTLYDTIEEKFSILLEYLFLNLLNFKSSYCVAHEATNALHDIFTGKRISVTLRPVILKFIQSMIDIIKEVQISLFFDVLLDIVIHGNIEDFLIGIFKELCERVNTQVVQHSRRRFKLINDPKVIITNCNEQMSKDYNIIINKCFNILRTITENERYVRKFFPQMAQSIDTLLIFFKNVERIEFDEDLVLIMTCFIKHLHGVPDIALKMLPDLPKYLKKCKGLLVDLYELMNYYIIYSNGLIEQNAEYCKIILSIFRKSLSKNSNNDKSQFLGVLLMQTWLHTSKSIPELIVREIFNLCFQQVICIVHSHGCVEDIEISSDKYSFVALIAAIFGGFLNYQVITLDVIIKRGEWENMIQWMQMIASLKIFSTSQIKCLIIGICNMLGYEIVITDMLSYVPKFLEFCCEMLYIQKKDESRRLKDSMKREMEKQFIDSDEEKDIDIDEDIDVDVGESALSRKIKYIDGYMSSEVTKLFSECESNENYCNKYTEEQELQDIFDRTTNSIMSMDEYKTFRELIDMMKSKYPVVYNDCVNNLSDLNKERLSTILHTMRIAVSNNKSITSVPRRVVVLKRTIINKPELENNMHMPSLK